MFKTKSVSGQPRSLRTIAEQKNSSQNFPPEMLLEQQTPVDAAASMEQPQGRSHSSGDKSPLVNMRSGK